MPIQGNTKLIVLGNLETFISNDCERHTPTIRKWAFHLDRKKVQTSGGAMDEEEAPKDAILSEVCLFVCSVVTCQVMAVMCHLY